MVYGGTQLPPSKEILHGKWPKAAVARLTGLENAQTLRDSEVIGSICKQFPRWNFRYPHITPLLRGIATCGMTATFLEHVFISLLCIEMLPAIATNNARTWDQSQPPSRPRRGQPGAVCARLAENPRCSKWDARCLNKEAWLEARYSTCRHQQNKSNKHQCQVEKESQLLDWVEGTKGD